MRFLFYADNAEIPQVPFWDLLQPLQTFDHSSKESFPSFEFPVIHFDLQTVFLVEADFQLVA